MSLAMAGSVSNGYTLSKSLRFRSSASAYLNRTFGTPTSATTWTISTWVKRGQLGTEQVLFGVFNSATDYFYFGFDATDVLQIFDRPSGGGTNWLTTTQVFRDPAAWYHIVYVFDTTQTTSTNRQKLYINGVQVTSFSTQTPGTQNSVARWNASGNVGYIGRSGNSGGQAYIDMYQAELNFIDGQALTPSSFGFTNATTGVWQPAKYTGTYGTNGFYLPFTNITSTTTLGYDFSGNSNNWTTNNLSLTTGSTYDSMTDVPTLTNGAIANYCVLNPLSALNSSTTADGNLKGTLSAATALSDIYGTMASGTTGKFYWETTYVSRSGNSALTIGGVRSDVFGAEPSGTGGFGYYSVGGQVFVNGSTVATYATYATSDVIGVALDLTNSQVSFYKQTSGTGSFVLQGTVSISSGYLWIPGYSNGTTSGNQVFTVNFGQQPFNNSSLPSGYVALNTYNLPTSTIVKGNTVMDATTYTGNGTAATDVQTITNASGFKPDLVWTKSRSNAVSHHIGDSVRGIDKTLFSNLTAAESNYTYDIHAFNSNGFTVGNDGSQNTSGYTYVGWQWQAGQGTTSNITVGQYSTSPNVPSIASTVSVNATAGFSIVTYTGTGANATVGHGLGVAPQMVIVKRRDAGSSPWNVWQTGLSGGTYFLVLSATSAQANGPTRFTATPTSTVFNIGTDSDVNASAGTYVAYCWTPIAGYSAFGSYTGNGSTDGTFVYLGFRPRYVMIKCSSDVTNWWVYDSSRNTYNAVDLGLVPSQTNADTSGYPLDFLSNGFKFRNSNGDFNGSGRTYIYMAFAENPFKNALAR